MTCRRKWRNFWGPQVVAKRMHSLVVRLGCRLVDAHILKLRSVAPCKRKRKSLERNRLWRWVLPILKAHWGHGKKDTWGAAEGEFWRHKLGGANIGRILLSALPFHESTFQTSVKWNFEGEDNVILSCYLAVSRGLLNVHNKDILQTQKYQLILLTCIKTSDPSCMCSRPRS